MTCKQQFVRRSTLGKDTLKWLNILGMVQALTFDIQRQLANGEWRLASWSLSP